MELHPDVIIAEPVAPPTEEEALENKISAALLGGAIADAMGWVTEFIKTPRDFQSRFQVDRIKDFISWEKQSGGRFNPYTDYVGAGEYSDDTQLTLCVARSIGPDGRVDNEYFVKVELPAWLSYARGAGATITAAARALSRKGARWNHNFFRFARGKGRFDYRQAGANGAAMRISPIAMANPTESHVVEREIWRNAIVTHGHPRAIVGALVYGQALCTVLAQDSIAPEPFLGALQAFTERIAFPTNDQDLASWLEAWEKGSAERFEALLSQTKAEMISILGRITADSNAKLESLYTEFGCFSPATKGSATSTVGAALATFLRHGRNYQHAVLEAVNMIGSDTDTIGAMAGSLAGAYAGYSAIPEHWATQMRDFSYFMRVAYSLARIAKRKSRRPELRRAMDRELSAKIPHVSSLARASNLASNMRVQHPIFGVGTVRNIETQQLRGRRDGSMLFIVVLFDSGQTCKFKFYRPKPAPRRQPTRSTRKQGAQGRLPI